MAMIIAIEAVQERTSARADKIAVNGKRSMIDQDNRQPINFAAWSCDDKRNSY
jgi:hypothetical protein